MMNPTPYRRTVELPHHDERPVPNFPSRHGHCDYCGRLLTLEECMAPPRDTYAGNVPFMQCGECSAAEVARLLPFV